MLAATDHHPFWSSDKKKWSDAGQLAAGDQLQGPEGDSVEIAKIVRWKELQPAYNLTVESLHTYFVLAGRTPVLVHNAVCPKEIDEAWNPGTFDTPADTFKHHYEKHGETVGVSPEQYMRDAREWAASNPGRGYNAKRIDFGNGKWGVKYTDPNGGRGGMLGPDRKLVSFWYDESH
ncbi:polymorphic toxin-type HINT domain-containing protein [Streptomyces anulatus]|uniref:polymorphic toxin-type HINT domain-containing protein n=1 Tax=Streptomyces anulatus TaxID=1892 RepID=UPI00363874F5